MSMGEPMTSFDARMRLLGEAGLPLGVEIDLTSDRMRVTASGAYVANWALHEIAISPQGDGFRIEAEGEEVIINLTEREKFATEIGMHSRNLLG
jgi:hypothetical protein